MSSSTSMTDSDEPVDQKLTQLVSYLDGELDSAEQDAVERALIDDPDMRSHADILSRTWAMLDELEEVAASPQFTQATLATVSTEMAIEASARPEGLLQRLSRFAVRYRIVPCFLAGVIGTTAGMAISNRMQQRRQSGDVAKDTIVLENLDLLLNDSRYRSIPDLQSLQQLRLGTKKPATEQSTDTP